MKGGRPTLTLEYNYHNGIVTFENAIDVKDIEVNAFLEASKIPNNIDEIIKNNLWEKMIKINSKEILIKYQKFMLMALANYCDIYPESIYSIQWQENIEIIVDFPGESEKLFNPSRTFANPDGYVNSVPSNRQLVVETYLDNDYDSGGVTWPYLNYKMPKPNIGDIVIYPASFFWSRQEKGIIRGRRIYLRSFFNGGKDFFIDDEKFYEPGTELLFSYMR